MTSRSKRHPDIKVDSSEKYTTQTKGYFSAIANPKKAKSKTFPKAPLWEGPYKGDGQGGITFSMLNKFLGDPEKFRLLTFLGVRERRTYSHYTEYGNMWHICEEALAAGEDWKHQLLSYGSQLSMDWPDSREDIDKWYNICKRQFPIYIDHWRRHPDVKKRKPLLQEVPFSVPYTLPSGRIVYLRGKYDSVDLINGGLYLQENKTKGDIDEELLQNTIPFNLQTMIYLISLQRFQEVHRGHTLVKDAPPKSLFASPIKGVRYNVVRRPLSDWKGGGFNIYQRKGRKTKKGIVGAETKQQYYDRLAAIIQANPEHFFMRWKAEIFVSDILQFREQCLDPILEWLCNWWDHCYAAHRDGKSPYNKSNVCHFRMPYGIYNPIMEGRRGDYYEYLRTGSTANLEEVDTLFSELQDPA